MHCLINPIFSVLSDSSLEEFKQVLGEQALGLTYKDLKPSTQGETQKPPKWNELSKAQQLDVKNNGKPIDYLLKHYISLVGNATRS